MLDTLITKSKDTPRTGFHCSDYGKSSADLFFRMKGVTQTNHPHWYDKLKWGAGRGVETEALQVLKDSGVVAEDYTQETHGNIKSSVLGVPVEGNMDAWAIEGYPIEIKSINNANVWDIQNYKNNNPRESYVGQLANYMYFNNVDKGALFVCSIDGLHRFWFECKKIGDGKYQCGNTVVDLNNEFKRWSVIWKEVQENTSISDEMLWEYKYKIPVEEIVWENVSVGDISKMRNNKKVYGDWQVLYSNYKDLILKLQGQQPGYTQEELKIINEKTAGYTTWPKK